MHHHRQRQRRLERILGDQRYLGQILVELVLAGRVLVPLQDEVGGGHDDDLACVGVEGIFSGQQRLAPHAARAAIDQLAVAIILAGGIGTAVAGIADHHTDMADLDHRLRHHLHGGEQAVDEVAALYQHLQLATATAAGGDELLRILKAVVEACVV